MAVAQENQAHIPTFLNGSFILSRANSQPGPGQTFIDESGSRTDVTFNMSPSHQALFMELSDSLFHICVMHLWDILVLLACETE